MECGGRVSAPVRKDERPGSAVSAGSPGLPTGVQPAQDALRNRRAVCCVLGAAAVGGLLFAPVFSVQALLLPVFVALVLAFLADEMCWHLPRLIPVRPLLVIAAGLLGVVWTVLADTTVAGIPSGRTLQLLLAGLTDSWQLALQSTWPARAEPHVVTFVPLAVLLAAVLGVELLHRVRPPLVALLPSAVVVAVSQAFFPLTGGLAVVAGLSYALLAAVLLMVTRPTAGPRRWVLAGLAVPVVVFAVVGALLLAVTSPLARPPTTVRDAVVAPVVQHSVAKPLDALAARVQEPEATAFTYVADAPVDRWTLAVLDRFDGVSWTADWRFRRLGTALQPDPAVTAPTTARTAQVTQLDASLAPWLPSQPRLSGVQGISPFVDEASGTLLTQSGPLAGYRIAWREPAVDAAELADAAVDGDALAELGPLGPIPPEFDELAHEATGGLRATFRAALVLANYLRDNYQLATGENVPAGHTLFHLRRFLTGPDKRGTTEQFAAAYVMLARIRGIPARLVVGFRGPGQPSDGGRYVVRNAQATAWPEVAVEGLGWVPLDPVGSAAGAGGQRPTGLAGVAEQVRSELPKDVSRLSDPPVAPEPGDSASSADDAWPWSLTLAVGLGTVLASGLLAWLMVPVVRGIRAVRRRRAVPVRAVVGAWAEVRDRLRAHGVPVSPGMTVRDLAPAAARIGGQATVEGVRALAQAVDFALWSGSAVTQATADQAWASVRLVRRGLATRPLGARLRAALDLKSLFPPKEKAPRGAGNPLGRGN